jgi:hypothetical protein
MEDVTTQLSTAILTALRTGASVESIIAQLEQQAERLRMALPIIRAVREAGGI